MGSNQRLTTAIVAAAVLISLVVYLTSGWSLLSESPKGPKTATRAKTTFNAPHSNPWSELTVEEASSIYSFIFEEYPELNLSSAPQTGRENHINFIEVLRPNKSDVLPFLSDEAGSPPRYAKVVLTETIKNETFATIYTLGPLPVSAETELAPMTWAFNSGRNYVPNPVADFQAMQQWALELAMKHKDITQELLGAEVSIPKPGAPLDPDALVPNQRVVRIENGTVEYWLGFMRPGPHSSAWSILPQGLFVKIQIGNDINQNWIVLQWYYNGVYYVSADELRKAMKEPGFEKTPRNLDGDWTATEDFESAPPGRDMAPPVMVQPNGARYRLDKKENFVSWMGFEFYIGASQVTGPALFDIKFKGESVMYELGLQEAMAHYAGDDPIQGGQEFMDTFFGMGKYAFQLVPGYDCPTYADYLSTTYHISQTQWDNPNSICVFEYTADHLLQRHTSQYQVTASRQTYLIVRFVSTVGNYDYTIDYTFYLDGTIEVKVRASGFIFAAFYNADDSDKEEKYGYRVHDAIRTSMHDHVINFKADMDVAGIANDFVRIAVEPTQHSYPWEQPEIPVRNTMILKEYPLEHESALDWPKNTGQMYTVYSADKVNKWGEKKGYRIAPGTGMGTPPHLTILNSTTMGKSGRWSEHDIWVVRNKPTEPKSADPMNVLDPQNPLVDFTAIANGESLDRSSDDYDGDLVVYFNLGAHHVPHSGDIPNTLMHTSASSVMFIPHNFADRDPSRATVQGVRLALKGDNGAGWAVNKDLRARDYDTMKAIPKYFGGHVEEGVCFKKDQLEPDLEKYDRAANQMTDLSLNGSLLGAWYRGDA